MLYLIVLKTNISRKNATEKIKYNATLL